MNYVIIIIIKCAEPEFNFKRILENIRNIFTRQHVSKLNIWTLFITCYV